MKTITNSVRFAKNMFLSVTIITLMLISCVRSVYPVTENATDIVFRNELPGHWKDVDGNGEYIVAKASTERGEYYKVTMLDRDNNSKKVDTTSLIVVLANIKGHYFLDCMLDTSLPAYSVINNWSKGLLIPSHLIIKVYNIGESFISMSAIDKDAFSLLLNNKKIDTEYQNMDSDNILLTESSAKLQEMLLKLEDYPSVYKRDSIIRMEQK